MVIAGDEPGGRSLRDLILVSMALDDEDEPLAIEHDAGVDNEDSSPDEGDC